MDKDVLRRFFDEEEYEELFSFVRNSDWRLPHPVLFLALGRLHHLMALKCVLHDKEPRFLMEELRDAMKLDDMDKVSDFLDVAMWLRLDRELSTKSPEEVEEYFSGITMLAEELKENGVDIMSVVENAHEKEERRLREIEELNSLLGLDKPSE